MSGDAIGLVAYCCDMARIVAIGGGEISLGASSGGTLEIDAEIVRLAATRRPRVLFVPTATQDDAGYISIVEEHYGRRLGCDVSPLLLYSRSVSDDDIERAIRAADIVYVGGGNTLRMMKLWRRRGVDRHLKRAADDGTVLAGISAGAICWCAHGVSDSRSFASSDDAWDFIAVRGLGLIDVMLCPHLDADPPRRDVMTSVAPRHRLSRLGLDDCAALEVVDEGWRILSSREGSGAHLVTVDGQRDDLRPSSAFRPLAELA